MRVALRDNLLKVLLLAGLSLALIAGCWRAGFTAYDDTMHITENPHLAAPVIDVLKPAPGSTYFPVTMLSYQLDHLLFAGWMPGTALRSWAPGVRLMTLFYHVLAALVVWRVLLRLRLSESVAFFIALVFAVHPLACETVCWTSERKNALAGLFGFAALWAYLAGDGRWWRMPGTLALYVLALASKPSALGLLPVFVVLELFGGAAGLAGAEAMCWRPGRAWVGIVERVAPLALAAALALVVNLAGHAATVIPPPGGSVFTAALTDLEILARYLYNLLLPVQLSAVYFVDPVRSLGDARVALYGLLLIALAALTIALAANRRRAIFGWLWFVGALGPNLNLIAIPHLMQDRYLYLSTPGAFLILVEVVEGLRARLATGNWDAAAAAPGLRAGYVAALVLLAALRGTVWNSMLGVFHDAVNRQPQAIFAYYGLGASYAQIREDGRERLSEAQNEKLRGLWLQAWKDGVDRCPDAKRYACYLVMALNVGEEFNRQAAQPADEGDRLRKLQVAEYYWQMAAEPPREACDSPPARALALGYLASLSIEQGRPDRAYGFAEKAVALCDEPPTRLVRARAAVRLAAALLRNGEEAAARTLLVQAREDASSIPPQADIYAKAQELLRDPLLAQ